MGAPQFQTQDDAGIGDGISPVPEWQLELTSPHEDLLEVGDIITDPVVLNVFARLRNILQRAHQMPFPTTQLHDLTCFTVHRLLSSISDPIVSLTSPLTECIRYGILLFMFTIQGPTYYSHAVIFNTFARQFTANLKPLNSVPRVYGSLDIWLYSVGMVASVGTADYQWYTAKARDIAAYIQVVDGDEAMDCVKSVLWLEAPHADGVFRHHWNAIFDV